MALPKVLFGASLPCSKFNWLALAHTKKALHSQGLFCKFEVALGALYTGAQDFRHLARWMPGPWRGNWGSGDAGSHR